VRDRTKEAADWQPRRAATTSHHEDGGTPRCLPDNSEHYTDLIFTTTTATMLTIAAVAGATAAATSYFSSSSSPRRRQPSMELSDGTRAEVGVRVVAVEDPISGRYRAGDTGVIISLRPDDPVVRWDHGLQAQTARHNLELERRRPVAVHLDVVARGPPRLRYNHVVRQRCSDYDLSVGQRVEYQINRRWLQATVRAFNRDGSVMLDLENGCLHRNADPAAAWPL
jgi:hypothetical protein